MLCTVCRFIPRYSKASERQNCVERHNEMVIAGLFWPSGDMRISHRRYIPDDEPEPVMSSHFPNSPIQLVSLHVKITFIFSFLFTGLLLEPYGLIYPARIVCIEQCLYVNYVCITVCEELNDDDDDEVPRALNAVAAD